MTTPTRPTRTGLITALIVTFALVVPLIAVAASALILRSWRDDLPAQVIAQWSFAGEPSRWADTRWEPLVLLLLCGGLVAFFGIIALYMARSGSIRAGAVPATLMSGVIGAAISATFLSTTVLQRTGAGQDDPAALVPILIGGGAFALVSVIGSVLLWRASPSVGIDAEAVVPGPELTLPEGARAVWLGRARLNVAAQVVLALVVLYVLGWLVWALIVAPQQEITIAISTAIALVVVLAVLSMLSWRVRVDRTGLHARALLGLPATHIPLGDIAQAHVIEVSPLRDFGGWGWRAGRDGRVGIVLRAGSTLEIERSDGRRFVVTIADAETAAGLINTLVRRQNATR